MLACFKVFLINDDLKTELFATLAYTTSQNMSRGCHPLLDSRHALSVAITTIISIISGSLFSSQQAQTSCSAAASDVIMRSDVSSRYPFH